MKYICAWCKKPVRETEQPPRDAISHTICEECGKKLRSGGFEDGKFTFDIRDERTAA